MTEPVAVFPLGTVLFPGMPLPLRLFEDRYRAMAADLAELPPDLRRIAVVAIRDGHEVGVDAVRSHYDVGTVAAVTGMETMPDGTVGVTTIGTGRVRLGPLDRSRAYLRAQLDLLPEPVGDPGPSVADVTRSYRRYREALAGASGRPLADPVLPDDPIPLSYAVAATVVADTADRQSWLELPDAAGRLAAEHRFLRRESVIIRMLGAIPANGLVGSSTSMS